MSFQGRFLGGQNLLIFSFEVPKSPFLGNKYQKNFTGAPGVPHIFFQKWFPLQCHTIHLDPKNFFKKNIGSFILRMPPLRIGLRTNKN